MHEREYKNDQANQKWRKQRAEGKNGQVNETGTKFT